MTLLSNVMLAKFGSLSIYGSDIPISVYSIQTKVYTIICNIVVGIALGGQPILGYNYGAGLMDRVRECYKLILKYTLIVGITASLIFLIYPQAIISIFGVSSDIYLEFATNSFRISLGLCFITCFIKISSIFFQAIGKPLEAMLASVVRDSICFVILTIFLCNFIENLYPGYGIYGILIAAPLSDIVAGSIIAIVTKKFFKKLTKQASLNEESKILDTKAGLIITITREHGTAGKKLAEELANRLNIPLYYNELSSIFAKESGIAKEYFSNDFDNGEEYHELNSMSPLYQNAIKAEAEVINKIADRGSCVIVGRCANHILKSRQNVVRIFLYANEEYRIKNISKMYGDSYAEAKTQLNKSDTSRANYFEMVTGQKWQDIKNYDLCIDVSKGQELTLATIDHYLQLINHKY